jgi:hypothetical protein
MSLYWPPEWDFAQASSKGVSLLPNQESNKADSEIRFILEDIFE